MDCELDVRITSDVLLDPVRYAGHRFHLARGTLNGHPFQMVYPEAGQPGFNRSNAGVVLEWPTRMGIPHAPPAPPYELTEAMPGVQERGATVIAFPGVTGGHPYVFSAQLAVLAARYLREQRGHAVQPFRGPLVGTHTHNRQGDRLGNGLRLPVL